MEHAAATRGCRGGLVQRTRTARWYRTDEEIADKMVDEILRGNQSQHGRRRRNQQRRRRRSASSSRRASPSSSRQAQVGKRSVAKEANASFAKHAAGRNVHYGNGGCTEVHRMAFDGSDLGSIKQKYSPCNTQPEYFRRFSRTTGKRRVKCCKKRKNTRSSRG